MKKKTFDCVEMKRQAASRIFEETRSMSLEERQAYWREKHLAFVRRQEERRHAAARTTESA
jgi:hypothetical protein